MTDQNTFIVNVRGTECAIDASTFYYPEDVQAAGINNLSLGVIAIAASALAGFSLKLAMNAVHYGSNHDGVGVIINAIASAGTGFLASSPFIGNYGIIPASETALHLVDSVHFLGNVMVCKAYDSIFSE